MKDNHPDLWKDCFPIPKQESHKYDRGHAVIYGAPELTGATRLAAGACARIGAGLTTVLCTTETTSIYRTTLPAHIMVRDNLTYRDPRITARLYGPGGLPKDCKISLSRPAVLDADALKTLPDTLNEHTILTPHEGEFKAAFPHIEGTALEKAQIAAKETGALIVLKGAHTIIAHPDGRSVINTHATPYLATAGSGDVLAGMITGLLAQHMPPFETACATAWLHGEAARRIGPGLVASDLPESIPQILRDFA